MFAEPRRRLASIPQRGLTLIELIIFIVIVSVALAGILVVMNTTTRSSADPLVRKQMLAIAEGLLEEVRMQPFTYCDPDDPKAATAAAVGDCTGGLGGPNDQTNPTPGEARGNAVNPLDNVIDYNGVPLPIPIPSLSGTFNAPPGYSAVIAVDPDAGFGPAGALTPQADTLLISVIVTHGADTLTLQAYRLRHSPNALP